MASGGGLQKLANDTRNFPFKHSPNYAFPSCFPYGENLLTPNSRDVNNILTGTKDEGHRGRWYSRKPKKLVVLIYIQEEESGVGKDKDI